MGWGSTMGLYDATVMGRVRSCRSAHIEEEERVKASRAKSSALQVELSRLPHEAERGPEKNP